MIKAYFITGLNGAGKSTYRDLIGSTDIAIIDPDKIKKDTNCSEIEAGKKAISLFDNCIQNSEPFVLEATLTSKVIFRQINIARKNNYQVNCIFIGLASVNLHKDRITNRVQKGGHDIPVEIIERRFDKSYNNVKELFKLSDRLTIFDNVEKLCKQFELKNGVIEQVEEPKQWVKDYVITPYNNQLLANRNKI